jgi:hypothetical protein
VAVLPDEEDVAVREDGDDRYCAGMCNDLPRALGPVRRLEFVDVQFEEAAAEDALMRNDADRFRRRCSPPRAPGG